MSARDAAQDAEDAEQDRSSPEMPARWPSGLNEPQWTRRDDQAGVLVRSSLTSWVKAGVEVFEQHHIWGR